MHTSCSCVILEGIYRQREELAFVDNFVLIGYSKDELKYWNNSHQLYKKSTGEPKGHKRTNRIKKDYMDLSFSKLLPNRLLKVELGCVFLSWDSSLIFTGFYLGYLRGRTSTPLKGPASPPPPPKYIVIISNYIGKIIQTRWGQCTHCTISQNCFSKCNRLHISAYSFQKISWGMAPDPLGGSSPLTTRDFSPKR